MILPGFPNIFAGRAKIFATWVGSGYTTTDLTTVTLSGIPLGVARTNRRLLAVMQWEANANGASAVTSLSIDGTAGTEVVSWDDQYATSARSSMWIIDGDQNATTGDVVVTVGVNVWKRMAVDVYAVYGDDFPAVLDTAVDSEATSSTQLYSTIQTSVSGPCIVGVSCGDSSNNVAIVPPTLGRFSVSTQDTHAMDIFFKPDGTKMYVVGDDGNDVNEYNLSTAWNVTTASYLQNFSVSAQESIPQSVFFKPDGTKMYVIGNSGDDVNEYNLSTAWNVTTASYSQNFSVSAQEATSNGMFFKPDGTKMYVTGYSGKDVNEYNLSTAWNVTTASYLQNFSVSAQENDPQCVFFKPDGTKMYVSGQVGDDVNEYNLSTAWNVTTASYSQNFSVAAQETQVRGISFKDDGTKMYVIGDGGTGYVNEYSISTAWDLSTAVWVESELTRDNIYTLESNNSTFAVFSRNLTDNTDVTTSGAVGQKSMTAVSFF